MEMKDFSLDLVVEILKHTEPEDLLSAIRSSPVFLRVFNMYPKHIVETVLTRAMGPSALHHALALAYFKSGAGKTSIADESSSSSDSMPQDGKFEFPSDLPSLMEMLHTHILVDRFTNDYAAKALDDVKLVEQQTSSLCQTDGNRGYEGMAALEYILEMRNGTRAGPAELSPTERERFHRGFYRFELYCQINPSSYEKIRRPNLKAQLKAYGLIIGDFQRWEMAEMTCAHFFLCELAKTSLRKLNKQFFKAVVTSPGVKSRMKSGRRCVLAKRGRVVPSPDFESAEEFVHRFLLPGNKAFMDRTEAEDLETFAALNSDIKGSLATHLVMNGLEFMKQLVSADDDRRKALHREYNPRRREFDEEIFLFTGNIFKQVTWEDEGLKREQDDGQRSGTYGFRLWQEELHPAWGADLGLTEQLHYNPMMIMAIPFWDSERIRLPAFRDGMAWAGYASWGHDFFEDRSCLTWGESTEVRLTRYRVPEQVLERVIRDFIW